MAERKWSRFYYKEWVANEGLDLITGSKVDDVYTVPLKPWARTGGRAVHIQLDGTGELNGAYVCELPAGKQLEPQRFIYEEIVYILAGQGSTTVWYPGQTKHTFEWQKGSLFAIPLNAWHQHFNLSGREPARYLAVTTAPIIMNLYRNDDFIFNNDAVFPERYDGQDDYFSPQADVQSFTGFDVPVGVAFGNYFPDVASIPLWDANRGVNTKSLMFDLADGTLGAHILLFPGGTFSKVHRHGPGAHVVWLKGEGYTLMWPDGGEKVQEHWGPGTMIVPPSWWWHTHCVVSREPAQHLALKLGSRTYRVNSLGAGVLTSTRSGGSQMDYEDFPPDLMHEVTRLFAEECAKRGTVPQMEAVAG